MPDKSYTAHYIAGTHWDREWYQPFQDYRMRLVHVMDNVLDVLERDPRFAVFHADGQMSMIRDYLEIRPENRERIARLAQAGRLLLGPWFVLPDEMLVSGEALIRNLLLGHRLARSFGVEAMKFGYLCDEFGHISQMPQILAGFGIDAALLGRGTNEDTHPAHFIWQSPDGSRVLTYKLHDAGGYGVFTFVVRGFTSSAQPPERRKRERRRRDADSQVMDYLEDPDLEDRLRAFIEYEKGRTRLGLIMLIDALDHYPILAQAPDLLERMGTLFPDIEFIHSSLPQYAAAMRRRAAEMPVFTGEIRDTARKAGGYLYLISNCLSSRYPIKLANDSNQTLLERWAEPYLLWANVAGARHLPTTFLDQAWDFTLLNHPHDSICGCSIDQVHKDMEYRFDQARLIGEGVVQSALRTVIPDQQEALQEQNAFHVALAQAEPYARREVVVFDVTFPTDWQPRFKEGFIGEQKNSFRLYDAAGNEVPYQLLAVQRACTMTKAEPDSLVRIIKRDVHSVAAEVDLPALGYTTLDVRPATGPTRIWGTLCTGPLSAENEHLVVRINDNGTLRLVDKATHRTYDQLLSFVDDGEIGDGWFHIAPVSDELVSSIAAPCDAGLIANGPLMVTFCLRTRMQVPECFDWVNGRRSQQRRELIITSDVTVKKGTRAVFVTSTVDNWVRDHRLRVLLPTDLGIDTWWVDLPFDLVERRIALDPARVNDKELPVPEKNMQAVAALVERSAGLAFVSAGGLHEVAAHDDVRRTLAITLLRGFHRPVATDSQPGGQILGQHTFTFAIVPLSGESDLGWVLALRDQLATGVRVRQTDDGFGVTQRTASLLQVDPPQVRLSALKPAEDGRGAILRLYNPLSIDMAARVTTALPVSRVVQTTCAEEDGEELPITGDEFQVALPAKKIVSLRLAW